MAEKFVSYFNSFFCASTSGFSISFFGFVFQPFFKISTCGWFCIFTSYLNFHMCFYFSTIFVFPSLVLYFNHFFKFPPVVLYFNHFFCISTCGFVSQPDFLVFQPVILYLNRLFLNFSQWYFAYAYIMHLSLFWNTIMWRSLNNSNKCCTIFGLANFIVFIFLLGVFFLLLVLAKTKVQCPKLCNKSTMS